MKYIVFLLITLLSFQEYKAQKPKSLVWYEKAKIFESKRQFIQAKSAYHKAISSDKKHEKPYLALAKVHKLYGEKKEAIHVYETLLKAKGDTILYSSIYLEITNFYMKKGEYEQARKYLSTYLDLAESKHELYWRANEMNRQLAFREKATNGVKTADMPKKMFKGIHFVSYPVAISDSNLVVNLKMMENRTSETVVARSILTKHGWTTLKSLSQNINTAADQGGCTFTKDGKKIIFTSCDRKDGYGSCDLYESNLLANGTWSAPKNLGPEVNTASWESEPSLTSDGKQLYFCSRRSGGYGKEDIWMSSYENNSWTKPVNLGPNINTENREVTPFIHPYGTQLYYSATGANTLGGFDLFFCRKQSAGWSKGLNMGYPINTALHESALSFSEGGKYAFFARLTEATNFEDRSSSKIYSFKIPDSLLVLEKPIEKKEIHVFSGVLFDYGSFELKEEFKQELNNLFIILSEERINALVMIEGHTDNEGTSSYNEELSLNRARVVQQYLIDKGISLLRIGIQGKGDSEPISSNMSEDGRAKNRRIEVIFKDPTN